MMKVIIAGGRKYDDYNTLQSMVMAIVDNIEDTRPSPEDVEIVSGGARGADKLGERFAKENGFKVKLFPANWDTYGKSAGYIRNKEMADYADTLVAFWDGESKGTGHMIDLAKKKGLKVFVIKYYHEKDTIYFKGVTSEW